MKLALFDLDNTLLGGDSDFEWAQFLIGKGVLDRELYEARNQAFYDQYKAGTLDIHEFLDFQLKPLSRHTRAELDAWRDEFVREHIFPLMLPRARQLVKDRQAEADFTLIITATNSFVTAPVAREFGVEHLIATEPECINGQFTGKVSGTPSFREGKVTRLNEWLAGRGTAWEDVSYSWFYSDSLNDLPLLEKVSCPVAVDPDPTLEAHARSKGWAVLSLRD